MKEDNLSREPQSEMKETVEKKERIETAREDQHDADDCSRAVRKDLPRYFARIICTGGSLQ